MTMKPKSKFILITGASTGIGYGSAKELIRRGYTVLGSARKPEDADRVKTELGAGFIPLLFDVTDAAGVERAVTEVANQCQGQGLAGLINNAGISVSGPIELLSVDEMAHNFEVNVFGLLRVTKAFLPLLGAQQNHPSVPGRILNISSAAGKLALPFMAPYTGSKHAVEGISHAMRLEFMRYGIKVIIIGPGAIQTAIWGKVTPNRFKGTSYQASLERFGRKFLAKGEKGMPLEQCSRQIGDIFESEDPKVRYAIVQDKFFNWTLPLLLPQGIMDSFIRKLM
jgi:short-subunit dehydrogenase